MIEADALVRWFPGPEPVLAVDHVSFSVAEGETYGLLGTNGAGKTTTMRMLATLLRPSEGTARLCGHDVRTDAAAARRSMGFLSARTDLYGNLTVQELLLHFARLQGVADPRARAGELVERFALGDYRHQLCKRLSTGNAQKVAIARAVVHDPPVLVVDEPTAGLDVLMAESFLRFVEAEKAAGKSIVYSTHLLGEVERLCDRVGVVHRGRLLAEGTVAQLLAEAGTSRFDRAFVALVERADGAP